MSYRFRRQLRRSDARRRAAVAGEFTEGAEEEIRAARETELDWACICEERGARLASLLLS